jgi:hypothetical protein
MPAGAGFCACDIRVLSVEAVNHAIHHLLFVDRKRVHTCKLLAEPTQCLKYQEIGINHITAMYLLGHDVYVRCGEKHHTDTCWADDKSGACVGKIANTLYRIESTDHSLQASNT